MVRGRRVRAAKTRDEVSYTSPKRKDSRLENMGNVANGVTITNGFDKDAIKASPPATRSRGSSQKTSAKFTQTTNTFKPTKNSHITNYFQVVSPVSEMKKEENLADVFSLQNGISQTLYNGSCKEDSDYSSEAGDCFPFEIGCYSGFSEINDIIHSSTADGKKAILKNIFKRENCILAYKDDSNDSDFNTVEEFVKLTDTAVKEEAVFSENEVLEVIGKHESNGTIFGEDNDSSSDVNSLPNVRLSPRKHASTLQRCLTVKENVKTPHRIRLCEHPPSPSHGLQQLSIRPFKTRSRRRLNKSSESTGSSDTAANEEQIVPSVPKKEEPEIQNDVLSLPEEIKAQEPNLPLKERKAPPRSEAVNHKLTEYFPVRRSVRKTKKEVLEEKRKDLECAIAEQREDGLEIATFEGKGRGVITSRMFRRGEFVVEYIGELVSTSEAKLREAQYAQDRAAGCYMYYFRHNNNQYCIDATAESGHLGRLVNHSRNGNLITKSVLLGSSPHLVLLASQDIPAGCEVTYDYGDRSKESLQHHPWLAL